jgi:hypothetical protein
MKLKHLALIVAIALGASNLTIVVIRVLNEMAQAQPAASRNGD